jgi:phosphohistidine phosphatase
VATKPAKTKTLFLVRHAKSSWKDECLTDHDRPLNKRGKRDASEMARRLAIIYKKPDKIMSSTALRAISTAKAMAKGFHLKPSRIVRNTLIYEAEPSGLLEIIRAFDDRYARVLMVGHNPELTEAVNLLSGSEIENIPTCGFVVLRFSIRLWSEAKPLSAQLLDFDYPKKDCVVTDDAADISKRSAT